MSGSGDYILRQDALDVMCEILCNGHENCDENTFCCSAKLMKSIHAADVRPVVRGKWVDMGDFISCSSCNATRLKEFESYYGKAKRLDARTNYCPNCGADMREES